MIGYQRHVSRPFLHARDNMAEHVGDPQFVIAQITQNWLENQRGTWLAAPTSPAAGSCTTPAATCSTRCCGRRD
jgi:hypothetical protein